MNKILIQHLGPLKNANVTFGDFTILVGPQASGKSIFLQIIKLIEDKDFIASVLTKYGYIWSNADDFLELFMGEGMSQIWSAQTFLEVDGREIKKDGVNGQSSEIIAKEQIYYTPAQRVLSLQNGWPKPFSDYGNDPFVLKNFSEHLRTFMDHGPAELLMPANGTKVLRDDMYRHVFYDAELEMDISGLRKRVVLNLNGSKIPYMGWSAGQKEFTPLWLSTYMYHHPQYIINAHKKMIIFEEPEMGLHPMAIETIIIELLLLMNHGYKIVVSTHSHVFLEFAWAMQFLKNSNAPATALQELFGLSGEEKTEEFEKVLKEKTFKTYYFNRKEHEVKDISTLDAESTNLDISEWGGLSSFASKAIGIVAKNVSL